MASPSAKEDDLFEACSDDEKYISTGCPRGKLEWTPTHEEIAKLFIALDEQGPAGLALDWKCLHGKRPRTPPLGSGITRHRFSNALFNNFCLEPTVCIFFQTKKNMTRKKN